MPQQTQIYRATLDQQLRVFVEPAPYWRMIQLTTPDSPRVYVVNDKKPSDLGYNRDYKCAPLPQAQHVKFPLAPGQWLAGQAHEGLATLGIIESPTSAPTG